jgi:hypothetical protein
MKERCVLLATHITSIFDSATHRYYYIRSTRPTNTVLNLQLLSLNNCRPKVVSKFSGLRNIAKNRRCHPRNLRLLSSTMAEAWISATCCCSERYVEYEKNRKKWLSSPGCKELEDNMTKIAELMRAYAIYTRAIMWRVQHNIGVRPLQLRARLFEY